MQTELIPNPHAGETLREDFMKPLGISAGELAKHLGVPETSLGELIRGKRSLKPEMALRLSRYFGNSAEFWLGLQRDYDLIKAASSSDPPPFVAQISNLPYRRIPFGRPSHVRRLGIFPRPADWKSAIQQVGNLRYAWHAELDAAMRFDGSPPETL